MLWGATGYTGRLVAEALVGIGERPLLAGRNATLLRDLSESHGGLEVAVADVERSDTISNLLGEGDVLVSTVGPFTLYGKAALDAALSAGAHYLDSTGEPGFIRDVFREAGPLAERRGSTLVTAFGYDFVPGNVVAAAAVERAGPEARRVDVAYLLPEITGAGRGPLISTGTRASLLAILAGSQHSRRSDLLALEPCARRSKGFSIDGRLKWAVSIGGSEPLALPRTYPSLEEVGVYMELPGPPLVTQGVALGVSVAAGAICRVPQGRRVIESLVRSAAKQTGSGPSAESRARSGMLVTAVCHAEDGRALAERAYRDR